MYRYAWATPSFEGTVGTRQLIMVDSSPQRAHAIAAPKTTPNKLNTYLVTNNSNELSDVLFHRKMTREKEKVGHAWSVSIPRKGARKKEAGTSCARSLGVAPRTHKWIFIEKHKRNQAPEGKGLCGQRRWGGSSTSLGLTMVAMCACGENWRGRWDDNPFSFRVLIKLRAFPFFHTFPARF